MHGSSVSRVLILPLPWISSELGWFVAENGRQPWTIDGVLPTFLSASSITAGNVWLSLGGFVLFYSVLAIVELFLLVKYIRLGPEADSGGSPMGSPRLSLHGDGWQARAGE